MGKFGKYTCERCGLVADKKGYGIKMYCNDCKKVVEKVKKAKVVEYIKKQKAAGLPHKCKYPSCKEQVQAGAKSVYCEKCLKRNRGYLRLYSSSKAQGIGLETEKEKRKAKTLVCCGKRMQRVGSSYVYDCRVNDDCLPVWNKNAPQPKDK